MTDRVGSVVAEIIVITIFGSDRPTPFSPVFPIWQADDVFIATFLRSFPVQPHAIKSRDLQEIRKPSDDFSILPAQFWAKFLGRVPCTRYYYFHPVRFPGE